MSTTQQFMYVCLNTAIFAGAIAIVIFMLNSTQDRELIVVKDISDKSSISMQIAEEKESKQYTTVSGSSVYSNILSIADDIPDGNPNNVRIYIGSNIIKYEDITNIKERKAEDLYNLKNQTGSTKQYKRMYEYNEELELIVAKFEEV